MQYNHAMSWQKEIRMKFGYRLLGNWVANLLSAPYFTFIGEKIPNEYTKREISDLGCGDGYATEKIKELFRARSIKGYETNKYLIKRARQRGLTVEEIDLEKQVPKGEMATVWGVVHHLRNKEGFLKKIQSNFKFAVFNEPVKSFWAFLDGGEPLPEQVWQNLFHKTLGDCKFLRFKDNLFIFWKML
jgi:SAM-dependent methyltransferase